MAFVDAAGTFCMTPGFFAGRREETIIPPSDAEALRRLAKRVAELAIRSQETEKLLLWKKYNALQRTNPLVLCDSGNGWNEIITPDQLLCREPFARRCEMVLRK